MKSRTRLFFPNHSIVRRTICLVLTAVLAALCVPSALADAPALAGVFPDDEILIPGNPMPVSYDANVAGVLEVAVRARGSDQSTVIQSLAVQAGRGAVSWDGMLDGEPAQPGDWIIQLTLADASGARSVPQAAEVKVAGAGQSVQTAGAEAAPQGTEPEAQVEDDTESVLREPGEGRQLSAFPDPHELCYWGLDIDNLDVYDPEDQAKIWEILMQPVTVLDVGPKEHVYPLVSPDADPKDPENMTGQLHGQTAAVHVLEQLDNGWSLIEAFSADGYGSPDDDKFHDLDNKLIHGYVRTKTLKTVKPYKTVGLLIDKYTQRMHVFKDGKLFTTLLVSTGFPTASQPWNETPSGEFLVDTWVGKFPAGNMQCDLALRINGGCLIHEVPHRELADGSRNYGPYEPYLGQKASHGCVRVQRMRNNDGVNMAWLWNNLKRNTRVLILDDVGRATIPVPDSARTVYYNPDGGKSYHSDQNCSSVKERFLPLTALPYEALYDEPTNKLAPCYGCMPFFKVSDPDAAIPDDVMGADTQGE